jgi:hypothetical protein
LIADMANREELLDVELFDRIDHPRGISRLPPATPAFCNQIFQLLSGRSCPEQHLRI